MSGRPYPEGVTAFKEALGRLHDSQFQIRRLRQEIADAQQLLVHYDTEASTAQKELFKLMQDMDVQSNGNYGY